MKIIEVEVFDLRGDGTIVLKTRMEDASDHMRYAWYVYHKNHLLFRSKYNNKPFMEYTITSLGTYRVKAFVLDKKTQEKIVEDVTVTFDKKTSPHLFKTAEKEKKWFPIAERLEGNVWKFSVNGSLPGQADFAWYVYEKGEKEPVFKGKYSTVSEYLYTFTFSGVYKAKCFCRLGREKESITTDWFDVDVERHI